MLSNMVLNVFYIPSNFGFSLECTLVHVFFFAMLDQMDRSWVHDRLFFLEHIDGVKEFMNFIQGNTTKKYDLL
jgi:hypothetical protein